MIRGRHFWEVVTYERCLGGFFSCSQSHLASYRNYIRCIEEIDSADRHVLETWWKTVCRILVGLRNFLVSTSVLGSLSKGYPQNTGICEIFRLVYLGYTPARKL